MANTSTQPATASTMNAPPAQRIGQAKRRRQRLIRGTAGVLCTIAVWQLISTAYGIEVLLPPPLTVFGTLFDALTLQTENWRYGENIYVHAASSLLKAFIGFGLAAAVAVPLGMLIGRITVVRDFLDPLIKVLYPIPGIAWIPIAILWFGLGNQAIIFIVFAGCFFPILFNTSDGARSINPLLTDTARCFGARGPKLFARFILPATVPSIITGLRIGVGESWRQVVAGEIVAGQLGVGYLLNEARFYFRADDLLAAMLVISVVGFCMEKFIVGTLERRTVEKWEVRSK